MTETTQPGGFTPGVNIVFADGYCASSDFCNLVLAQVREVLSELHRGAAYTLRLLCDPQVWYDLTPSEHQEAGRIMVRLVVGGWLPLRPIGCRHSYPKKYTPD